MAGGTHRRVARVFARALGVATIMAAGAPTAVWGESLKEALTAAYLYNPTLKAARAQLRVIDNNVPLAKSGYRPQVVVSFGKGYDSANTTTKGAASSTTSSTNSTSGSIYLQQNLFNGFQTYNNVKGSEAVVEAGREDLRAAEQNVLLTAVTAYLHTFRDQAIVNLFQSNLKVLEEQLKVTQELFNAKRVTSTDVEQAKVALAQTRVELSIAQGTVHGDRALFAQYIGHPPAALKDPGPATRRLPKTLKEAINIAETENPGVISAIFSERAQQHLVKQLKGQLLPSLSAYSSYAPPIGHKQAEDTRVAGVLGVPIYEGGVVSAEIRQAIEALSERRHQIDWQRELARQNASTAWGLFLAAKGNLAAGQVAVETAKSALQDVRDEQKLGQRTIIDILTAARTYARAQINLVSFQHDLALESYALLAAMGRLTAADIALQAELYDPAVYYGQVKDAWYGWGASAESEADPRVAPVEDAGRTPSQHSDGPAYTQTLPQIP